jgi:hypothetical protein
VYLVCL